MPKITRCTGGPFSLLVHIICCHKTVYIAVYLLQYFFSRVTTQFRFRSVANCNYSDSMAFNGTFTTLNCLCIFLIIVLFVPITFTLNFERNFDYYSLCSSEDNILEQLKVGTAKFELVSSPVPSVAHSHINRNSRTSLFGVGNSSSNLFFARIGSSL